MKVVLISTSDRKGGAAIAANRLLKGLCKYYSGIRMLVRLKLSDNENISGLTTTFFHKAHNFICIFLERLLYSFYMKSRETLFYFSPANIGKRISDFYDIKEADILHFHWINQGFISLSELKKLFGSGKKLVWTLHDMWAFTGGCHYSGTCRLFTSECGKCPFLRTRKSNDLSNKVFRKKKKIYQNSNLTIVTPSHWLAEKVRSASLMQQFNTVVIPNPIDTEIFKPEKKALIRKINNIPEHKFIILAGSANLKDKRKGFHFVLKALEMLISGNPEIKEKTGLLTFGKSSEELTLPCDHYPISFLDDEKAIAMLYQLSDVYILPSLEDNLPGTVMESLSCGTPVVAFNTGGIPEMIDHEINGYLSDKEDMNSLCDGLKWIFHHKDTERIRNNCRRKVMENYSFEIISGKYYSLYESLINKSG